MKGDRLITFPTTGDPASGCGMISMKKPNTQKQSLPHHLFRVLLALGLADNGLNNPLLINHKRGAN